MVASFIISNNKEIIPLFTDLGENIRKQWAKYNYTEDALVNVSMEILARSNLNKQLSAEDLIDYSLNPHPSLSADQIDSPFGNLQQIMYRHARFYIEALYWCDGTTAIHDHGFSGSFYVMTGSSINLEYQFHETERINHHFWLGELSNKSISKLNAGSVKPIYSGKRFIHSVYHLENPTVSIVVRTYQDDDAMPQFEYRGNKIRLVEEFSPEFAKKIKGLKFVMSSDKTKFCNTLKKIYIESPIDERYWLLRAFYSNLKYFPMLEEYFRNINDNKTQALIESIREEAILHKILQIRNTLGDTELQFFIALLLNIPTWEKINLFIKNYYSNDNEIIIERSLSNLKSRGFRIPDIKTDKTIYKYDEPITNDNALYHLICKKIQKND